MKHEEFFPFAEFSSHLRNLCYLRTIPVEKRAFMGVTLGL